MGKLICSLVTSLLFFIPSSFAQNKKRVLIIDMPIKRELLSSEVASKVIEIKNQIPPKNIHSNCKEIGLELESFFNYGLKLEFEKISKLKHSELFEDLSYSLHGYHVLNTIAKNSSADIYHLGVRGPVDRSDLKDIGNYLKRTLHDEFNFIAKAVKRIKPNFVNVSGSESLDENINFFKENNYSNKDAERFGKEIFYSWQSFWGMLISKHPKTKFIVSAGNGGVDWKGDKLEKSTLKKLLPTPASLRLPNIIVVGSSSPTSKKVSSFSNYGSYVHFFENGEQLKAKVPCTGKDELSLTGTSQSTALYTNRLIILSNKDKKNK